jgi:hypothetical protein
MEEGGFIVHVITNYGHLFQRRLSTNCVRD